MSWLLGVAPVLGLIAMAMSLSHLLPAAVALGRDEGMTGVFLSSMAFNFALGALLWLTTRRHRHELQVREGILLVILVWTGGALLASVPLYFAVPGLSFTDAYFEAMSGLTATGATVLTGLDRLPAAVNVWRAELQWLGGMGVIVLVVAVLPMVGVGGRQISKAEIPGPMKDDALTPRMTQTAKGLWFVYIALTVACVAAYRAAGLPWLDALVHGFSTVSLGGFSSHDASLGFFGSGAVETVAIVFMLLAGMNFATHFMVWQERRLSAYRRDVELPWYLAVLGASVALLAPYLHANGTTDGWAESLRQAAFHVVSLGTNTGYSIADYGAWPAFAPLWLIFLGTFVACSGSAGGGIKMMRAIILYRQVFREFRKLAHPSAVTLLKLGAQTVPNQVVFSVLAFFFAWLATLVGMTLVLAFSGLDVITAFSAVTASLNNIGPGLAVVGPASNYAALTDFQTWVCTVTMLLGRLELLTVLVVLTPSFWRK